jgi:MFS superfamily sulfate permease-like transporter
VAQGLTNWTTVAIGVTCLAIVLIFKRKWPKIPGVLIAVIGATIVVGVFNLATIAGVSVVGPLPQGLPSFQIPMVSLADLSALAAGALAITLVSFADTSVLSRTFALRGGYEVDGNQELIALGAANVAAGFFQGFSISSSSSRTPVAESAGSKTQLTGVVGAVCIALLLVFAPTLLQNLPNAALGAVVIAACISLVDIHGVVRLYHLRRSEFAFSIACFLGVALIGVIQGIFIAIALALLAFVWRAWRPYDAVLGRVDGLKGYHDITRHPEARPGVGLVPLGCTALLCQCRDLPRACAASSRRCAHADEVGGRRHRAGDGHRHHGGGCALGLDDELQRAGIELCFAEMKGRAKDRLKQYGLFTKLGDELFFRTIGQAVDGYLNDHPVEWADWED